MSGVGLGMLVCAGCGVEFMATRKDQRYHDKLCNRSSRSSRARSDASKASSRKRDKQRDKQRTKDKITDRVYVGWDGEGCNPIIECDGVGCDPERCYDGYHELDHRYQYMAGYGTDGKPYELFPQEGEDFLATDDVLWFLWRNGLGKSNWFFAGKYDWTHILRSMLDAEDGLEVLWQIHHPEKTSDGKERDVFKAVRWGDWGVTYVQGSVTITRYFRGRKAVPLAEGEAQCGTWHSCGDKRTQCSLAAGHTGKRHNYPGVERGVEVFFQDAFRCFGGGSFVALLKAWDICSAEEIAEIQRWKDQRAHFRVISREVQRYCQTEVKYLALAAQKIVLTFNEMGIRPKRWYSAGSAAKAMLRKYRIVEETDRDGNVTWEGYRGPDRYAGAPEEYRAILDRTYFGGWFENAETGVFEELFSEDFKSAYPAIIRDLPCLQHGAWTDHYSEGGVNFARISWDLKPGVDPESIRWAPGPWRFPSGRVYRPTIGEGWYCEAEITAMQKLPDFDFEVHEWISFERGCDHQPFAWVQDVYDLRVELGNDGRGLVLKVSLNSIYGSFADTLQKDSRYASIVWASMITGGCRAKILDEIAWRGDKIVAIATDGIMSTEQSPRKQETNVLGELNFEGSVQDAILIQPGLYLARVGKDPKKTTRSRGHNVNDLKDISERLRKEWDLHGWDAEVTYERTRLIPAKLALARTEPRAVWGQWVTQPVTLKFIPTHRQPLNDPGPRKRSCPTTKHLGMTMHGELLDTLSYPFDRRKSADVYQDLADEKELDDGQP